MTDNKIIRLLCTSDVHGKVFPHSYVDGSRIDLGFARLKTYFDSIRDEGTVLIDNGDVLVGSPFQLYHMMNYPLDSTKLSPVTIAMGEIGYDFMNLGNHDFNYGATTLFNHIKGVGSKCITQNVSFKSDDSEEGVPIPDYVRPHDDNAEHNSKPYDLIDRLGKKIAIFGLVTHFVPHWENEEHIKGFTFYEALETAKKIVEVIKNDGKADYIVCVYHGGFEYNPETDEPMGLDNGENQGYKILNEIPEIDVFFTGHQHLTLKGDKYLQPGEGGALVSCAEIDIETGEVRTSLIKVDEEADSKMLEKLQEEEDKCQIWLDEIIGESKQDILIHDEFEDRLHKSQLVTYINQAQMAYTDADISAVALFSGATGLGKNITIRQMVSTYVFPDNLVVKRITGKTLRSYLEKNFEYWIIEDGEIKVNPKYCVPTPQHFNYDMLDGVEYTAKISNPVGERIISLTRDGIPVTDDMVFSIVLSNYRAAGGGNFFMISEAETIWQDSNSILDILIKDVTEKKIIEFDPVNNIKIII